jgi:oxygen-independent coproporphyrinogen III oxidase
MQELIKKYNVAGPRYTSYPPVPFWRGTPTSDKWIEDIKNHHNFVTGLDLYIHIPFCDSLCYYCGCSRVITKDHSVEKPFIDSLLQEWNLYIQKIGLVPRVHSLHFGGGTPTFLSPSNLDFLISDLTANRTANFIGSIEIDPRTCQTEHLEVIQKHGIKRVSLGIQDFDPSVQRAIHRHQTPHMIESLVSQLRRHKFESINFDLIYGLPKQTLQSIHETISIVKTLKPDMIAFYSYAHLPDKIKNQRLIKSEDLPSAELKRSLYDHGKKLLIESGYVEIGMDHFALPGNFLYQAKNSGKLKRNFMGYVDKKAPVLLGLGPTAISDSSVSFMQNVKDVKQYQAMLEMGQLPIEKGHQHSTADLLVQGLIQNLMCNHAMNLAQVKETPYWGEIKLALQEFEQDGIVQLSTDRLTITNRGLPFVRNVAMAFDFHLREQNHGVRFSQTI